MDPRLASGLVTLLLHLPLAYRDDRFVPQGLTDTGVVSVHLLVHPPRDAECQVLPARR